MMLWLRLLIVVCVMVSSMKVWFLCCGCWVRVKVLLVVSVCIELLFWNRVIGMCSVFSWVCVLLVVSVVWVKCLVWGCMYIFSIGSVLVLVWFWLLMVVSCLLC